MNLRKRYQQELKLKGFESDSAQLEAVDHLCKLSSELEEYEQQSSRRHLFFRKKQAPPSVYFWGGVGRGKTFIMDLFYDEVEIRKKKRIHFHRFMKFIHDKLSQYSQTKNPLDKVIAEFSTECLLLCLDEFFVSDIADAMILGNLLNACYREGIVVVTTSNIYPDGLYLNGLQRSRFIPAIEGINRNFTVIQLDGGSDYRLTTLMSSPLFFTPVSDESESNLHLMFNKLAPDLVEVEKGGVIDILGRNLSCIQVCEDILWIEFSELCEGPRSVHDYIELSQIYHAVLISKLPELNESNDDAARRFVNMIDEFYDRGVKLIISSQVPIDNLYSGTRLKFEFERTVSRLLEMQSDVYLARAHLPE